ncbi:MAG: hypothetical protein A2X23_08455 [Chloroflexi bacterium GWC2_73_18]|nr:MAG: hypothetical protein A2X23_08455 [Chloroflexi bacterium GWC2_73_18]
MDDSFSWDSPLGVSVALFLAYGAIHLVTGGAYALVAETEINRQEIFFSPGPDRRSSGRRRPTCCGTIEPSCGFARSRFWPSPRSWSASRSPSSR